MKAPFSVSLNRIIDVFALDTVVMSEIGADQILVSTAELNRPGLQFGGYYEFFDSERLQIIGKTEQSFILNLPEAKIIQRVEKYFSKKPKAVIVCRNLDIIPAINEAAKKYDVPLLRTSDSTSAFMAALISFLNVELAPRITRHGVLVEVYGEGVLIMGESGVGKSETAVELVKRGHRLIADDAVELRKVSSRSLVGSSPENIRHFVELRGIGIINVRRIFGIGAVKMTEKIDMIINLEQWDPEKTYDRMGLENEYTKILGISIPSVTIPVKPGRNLAIIIETAAMNNRQKKMGYNAAAELLKRLGMIDETEEQNSADGDIFF